MRRLLACVCLLCPVSAFAQSPEPAPTTQPPAAPATAAIEAPRWSLGFGYAPSVVTVLTSNSGLGGVLTSTPRVSTTVERRVGDATWLGFQLGGRYGSSSTEDSRGSESGGLYAQLGVRHVLNPKGLVEVSLWGAASADYWTGSYPSPSEQVPDAVHSGRGFSLGLVGGLALERELVQGLALRLSSSVAQANWGKTMDWASGSDLRSTSEFGSVSLAFAPMLELRYAF
jgi:hypothetical protein